MSAPARSSQPSRKSKSAWRKNIDLSAVTAGLESAREETRQTGGLLADALPDTLFQTDIAGDVGVKRKAEKEHGKLKVDEILAQRSAVPAVTGKKRSGDDRLTDGIVKKKQKSGGGVSRQEYERLRQVAFGGSSSSVVSNTASIEDGKVTVQMQDPWAVSAAPPPVEPLASWAKPIVPPKAPRTLTEAPISLTANGKSVPHVSRPAKSASYNPSFPDWSAALEAAGVDEVEAERLRQAKAAAEAEHEARVAKAGEEAERDAYASGNEGAQSDFESEWEGIASEAEGSELKRKRPERKTPSERNKIKRRKEAEAKARHEAKEKKRDEQVKRFDAIRAEAEREAKRKGKEVAKVDSGISVSASSSDDEKDASAMKLRKARFGQRPLPQAQLELVLPDELEDSLRRLKPEGNLLNDRFRNMIVQGRIEARPKPLGQQRKKRVKSMEKWGFKDWKLDT